MKGGISQLMKQARDMQESLQKAQEELKHLEIHGESGGGMVKITMTGRHNARSVSIDDSLFNGNDKEMIEDLIVAAINDAVNKVEKSSKQKMSSMTGGIELPAGFKL